MEGKRNKLAIVRALFYIVFFCVLVYVFYLECLDIIEADMHAHIRDAIGAEGAVPSYTFLSFAIAAIYPFGGEVAVAVLLALLEIATLAVSEGLMRKLMPNIKAEYVFVLSVLCNFAIAIWVPFVHHSFSNGVATGNSWHNSTYLGMRLASLGAIWFYLRIVGRLESNKPALDWAGFTATTIISAGIKPSFVVVFGPALVILCIVDLVKYGPSTLKRSFGIAAVMVATLAIIYWQASVLYTDDDSSGIGIGFAVVWSHYHDNVAFGILQSFAFPICVILGCFKEGRKDRNFTLAWIVFLFALAEELFLYETGPRIWHGNFGWSLSFGVYYLMIASIVTWLNAHGARWPFLLEKHAKNDDTAQADGASPDFSSDESRIAPANPANQTVSQAARIYDVVAFVLFALHSISGLGYFAYIMIFR